MLCYAARKYACLFMLCSSAFYVCVTFCCLDGRVARASACPSEGSHRKQPQCDGWKPRLSLTKTRKTEVRDVLRKLIGQFFKRFKSAPRSLRSKTTRRGQRGHESPTASRIGCQPQSRGLSPPQRAVDVSTKLESPAYAPRLKRQPPATMRIWKEGEEGGWILGTHGILDRGSGVREKSTYCVFVFQR